MMWDPIAVQVAMSGGVGAKLDLRLGGKMGPMSGDPLDLTVTVSAFVEDMVQEWPQQGDPVRIPCGESVCLHCNGIDIIVCSRRVQAFSPDVFSNLGVRSESEAADGGKVFTTLLCRIRADRIENHLHGRARCRRAPLYRDSVHTRRSPQVSLD